MTVFSDAEIVRLLAAYGYGLIALVVGLESLGLPLPGETMLVLAAIYAGTTGHLDISLVIAAAAIGAVVGDNGGYWLGREFGTRLLVRHGHRFGVTLARIKVGQYLFRRHGGKVVFFGRFVALLRILAAALAGANRMPWRRFLLANTTGALAWAMVFGLGGYLLGDQARRLSGPAGMALLAAALVAFFAIGIAIRRHHAHLEAAAEKEFGESLGDTTLNWRAN